MMIADSAVNPGPSTFVFILSWQLEAEMQAKIGYPKKHPEK
jgi:hypothetical protein